MPFREARKILMEKRAEITLEVEETLILRSGERMASEFCPNCKATSVMAAPEILAAMTGSSEREIFRLIEAGAVWFSEGARLVACLSCFRSLELQVSETKASERAERLLGVKME